MFTSRDLITWNVCIYLNTLSIFAWTQKMEATFSEMVVSTYKITQCHEKKIMFLKCIPIKIHNNIMYVLINSLQTSTSGRSLKFHEGYVKESGQGWGFEYYSDRKSKEFLQNSSGKPLMIASKSKDLERQ
jgi:hypothetical protein